MTRLYRDFSLEKVDDFKQQMLSWASQFDICCFLDNNHYQSRLNTFECLVAVGIESLFEPGDDFFSSLSLFDQSNIDWIFGHFNYDLKKEIEPTLTSGHPDNIGFPDCFLFVPQMVLYIKNGNLTIGVFTDTHTTIFTEILNASITDDKVDKVDFNPRISKEHYLDVVEKLRGHLKVGDCYEINFCQEFYASASIDPPGVYKRLNQFSPSPFSAFYKIFSRYLLGASPERYIKKEGRRIISQPMKGTARRDLLHEETDTTNKKNLLESDKERSENVMIVDLVRNDLSKICKEGTVHVDELFGVYTFPNVHQMISTVSGKLNDDMNLADVLQATFPMGSMTGAPKNKVMQLIEKYESSKRGIFSGAVGYISPQKDFDFNVVIRSIMYNKDADYLSYQVGSAITINSSPIAEYEECLLKAAVFNKIFSL